MTNGAVTKWIKRSHFVTAPFYMFLYAAAIVGAEMPNPVCV